MVGSYGIYAIPIGMLAGYLGFYAWFAAFRSLKSLKISFLEFEKKSFLLPFIILILYCFYAL